LKAWVRIDADVFAHPKLGGITPASFTAWVKGLGHCRQFRTDGVIAARVVPAIANKKTRGDLVGRELWHEREDGGIDVHDYGVYQLTEADWQAKSDAGKKGAEARWGDGTSIAGAIAEASDSDATAITTDSDSDFDLPFRRLFKGSGNGLSPDAEYELERLLEAIGTHADKGTEGVLQSLATRVSPFTLARVRESLQVYPVNGSRAAYAVAALQSEIEEAA